MAKRKIIEIDRDLCNGCGACTTACDEAALELDDEGKAILVKELYCDGMGMCLDVCPTGALTVVERDTPAYDYQATVEHVKKTRGDEAVKRTLAEHSGTVKALHLLTGGNPRLIKTFYRLLRDGLRGDIRADLEKLLEFHLVSEIALQGSGKPFELFRIRTFRVLDFLAPG